MEWPKFGLMRYTSPPPRLFNIYEFLPLSRVPAMAPSTASRRRSRYIHQWTGSIDSCSNCIVINELARWLCTEAFIFLTRLQLATLADTLHDNTLNFVWWASMMHFSLNLLIDSLEKKNHLELKPNLNNHQLNLNNQTSLLVFHLGFTEAISLGKCNRQRQHCWMHSVLHSSDQFVWSSLGIAEYILYTAVTSLFGHA
jgi:hypothetical protein